MSTYEIKLLPHTTMAYSSVDGGGEDEVDNLHTVLKDGVPVFRSWFEQDALAYVIKAERFEARRLNSNMRKRNAA